MTAPPRRPDDPGVPAPAERAPRDVPPTESETGDEALLDRLLSEFVRAVAQGREVDLAAAVPGRPDLLGRVREVWETALEIAPRRPAPACPAEAFAGYEIVREIGHGGMGQVFLARHATLGRLVALKVLPHRAASRRARERFLREARAVARLDHPLIVPVYDLGESGGQAYFTMQYVEGRTAGQLLRDVRGRAAAELTGGDVAASVLGPDPGPHAEIPPQWRGAWPAAAARIALDVADALGHAHAAGIVHRDVKPSNVMLRRDGFALLFDFGLASVEDEATLTLSHAFLGTPHYASPEQAAGETDSLDGRSDVFSLGATLYELLTLDVPFPGPTTSEVLRRVQAWDPEPPSRVNAAVPPDLEAVCLKALEKERDRRYASAAEMADDLRAALAGRRVKAKRAGAIGRGLRLVKRGRALTELLVEQRARSAELRSLVLRAERSEKLALEREADALRAREDAERERRRAESERDAAREVVRFLTSLLASADPRTGSKDIRVVDALARAEAEAPAAFHAQPGVLAEILGTLCASYFGLGRYDDAQRTGESAVAAARAAFGEDDLRTSRARHALGGAYLGMQRADLAEREFRAAWEVSARVQGPEHAGTLGWLGDVGLALICTERVAEAESVLRDVLAVSRRVLGADHEVTLAQVNNLALALRRGGAQTSEAGELYAECYEARRRVLGEEHTSTNTSRNNYAAWLHDAGRSAEAEELVRTAHAIALRRLGPAHRETLLMANAIAVFLRHRGLHGESEAMAREIVETWRGAYGGADPQMIDALRSVVLARSASGDLRGAERTAEEQLAEAEASGNADHVAHARAQLAVVRARLGDPDAAEALARDAAAALATAHPIAARHLRATLRGAAGLLEAAGRTAAAAELRAQTASEPGAAAGSQRT